jgi:FKBP-type peptidyl-prolyl cis-trans isomerase SlyD
MRIGRDTVVALDLELADLWGNPLQAEERVRYLHGYDEILPALERALEGKGAGEKLALRLEPEDAFGEYDEGLLRVEPRAGFPEVLEAGMQFEGVPGGVQDGVIYTVTDVAGDKVVLDGNHPLAGIAIEFRAKVREVRGATVDEIAAGRVEDPGAFRLRVADA